MPDVFSLPARVIEKHGVRMLVVGARLNGKGPYRLLVDTAANALFSSLDLAPDLELRDPLPTSAGVAGRATPLAATAYRLDSFEVVADDGRRHETPSLEVVPIVMAAYEEDLYHGLLGMNWFAQFPQVCFRLDPPGLDLQLQPWPSSAALR